MTTVIDTELLSDIKNFGAADGAELDTLCHLFSPVMNEYKKCRHLSDPIP